ncbi:ATP-binding protein [Lacibacter sp. H375]|uniref:ATP-binding protein n=1 Tax=Lacibacter sp. H375 TaxID=3133424 RepID=UPI0030BD2230
MIESRFNNIETADATPNAASLIETFRAIGYDIETAIADLIDNSISAGASEVHINYNWKGKDTSLYILDNGVGMNDDELIEAMRPGTKNPLSEREENDLGRFGLGLKTASFSQCRHLTVITKSSKKKISYWTWDLDYVSQSGLWHLIKIEPSINLIEKLNQQEKGTIVEWKFIDRITKDYKNDEPSLKKFTIVAERIKAHLSMIFHRFIESKELTIWFQDREIKPWNPFLSEQLRVQNFPSTSYCNNQVQVKGYVLKHKSAFTTEEFQSASGIRGWNDHQGFYIYRKNRMLVSGSWLGLWAKEEHYKLARISIDISNNVDTEWQIDIRKAIARLPSHLKDSIKSNATDVRSVAVNVYRTKSKPVLGKGNLSLTPLWKEFTNSGTKKWTFRINREHLIISETLRIADSNPSKAIKLLLRLLEETVPVKSIFIKEAEDSYNQTLPFEEGKRDEMLTVMQEIYKTLLESGLNDHQAKIKLEFLEPFNHYPEEIKNIDKK